MDLLRTACTRYGMIEGIPGGDPRVTLFKGVPYAKPPVGELRFRAPQPPEPWQGVRKAERFGPVSWQGSLGTDPADFYTRELHPTAAEYPMAEDCLYLNIWTPAVSPCERLPVLFYIHGGGFTGGYSYEMEFDGERVARNGILLVTVGYRLGALGFFAHPELRREAPGEPEGNNAMLDQLMALQWVKENIAAFGGDPERITIAGQSAGGVSVGCLVTSPMSKGAFNGAIIMSSGGLPAENARIGRWRTLAEAYQDGQDLLDRLGVKTVAEARALPAERIVRASLEELPRKTGAVNYSPTIDGRFLTEDVREAMLAGHMHPVPLMIGCCWGENLPHPFFGAMLQSYEVFCRFLTDRYGAQRTEKIIRLAGIHGEADFAALAASEPAFGEFFTGAMSLARHASGLGRTVYAYVFDGDIPGEDRPGSYHGSELWFFFDSLGRCWRPFEGRHYDLARQVSSYVANFVKTGDPNGTDRIGKELPPWPRYTAEDRHIQCLRGQSGRLPEERQALRDYLQTLRIEGES